MEYFPIFIDLHDKQVLVIGQYRVLEFKMEKMIEAGAKIIYLSDSLPEPLEKHVKSGRVIFYKEEYNIKYLKNIWLVVVGSNDMDLKLKIEKDAENKNIFCNFVDEAPISSFISPSVISKGILTIAISTKGRSPALNKVIKKKIDDTIGYEYVDFIDLLGEVRQKVLDNIPTQKQRGELLDTIAQNPEILNLIKKNNQAQAEQVVHEMIEKEINSLKLT